MESQNKKKTHNIHFTKFKSFMVKTVKLFLNFIFSQGLNLPYRIYGRIIVTIGLVSAYHNIYIIWSFYTQQ